MRTERRSGSDERRVAIGMITDAAVLAAVAARWDRTEGLFASAWANLVGGWCVRYYERYGTAPGPHIQGMYDHWAGKGERDKDTLALVERFLSGLSDEYETLAAESNSQYTIDLAGEHFNRVRLQRLADAIYGDLDSGDPTAALARVDKWGRVELGGGAGVDVLSDAAAIEAAFEAEYDPIVVYPGALGQFFGRALQRDGFVAIMAPEKRGKTWWLMDLAWQAMVQRRRVAFFQVGDLSQNQCLHRFAVRAARHPMEPGTVRLPKELTVDPDAGRATVSQFREMSFTDALTPAKAIAAMREVVQTEIKDNSSYLRLSVHPNTSINVHGVRGILEAWERAGWVADVVVIDYADILAPIRGAAEENSREQINNTWKHLRALSQQLHCLVVTATQADAASYSVETLGRANFSEDKRKFAHVTGMFGLNATEQERDDGIMRLNWLVLRESKYSERKCVHVAGCLDIGRPAIISTF
jgi:hypothetical protein